MAQDPKGRGNDARVVVLYVEDHPVNVVLMQTVFELRPELDLVIAVDGESAMSADVYENQGWGGGRSTDLVQ